MFRALALSSLLALSACGTWDDLTPTQQVLWGVVGVGAGVLLYCEADDSDC